MTTQHKQFHNIVSDLRNLEKEVSLNNSRQENYEISQEQFEEINEYLCMEEKRLSSIYNLDVMDIINLSFNLVHGCLDMKIDARNFIKDHISI